MNRKESLERILREYEMRGPEIIRLEIVYRNGERAGIGNPAAISVAMGALKQELKRQINEA